MKKCGALLFFVALLCSVFLSVLTSKTTAVTGAWSSGAIITDVLMPEGLFNTGNLDCSFTTLRSKYIFNELKNGSYISHGDSTTEEQGKTYTDVCVVQNNHGLMSGTNLWAPTLDKNRTLPVESSPYTMMPSPGGSAVMFIGNASGGSFQYSINHSLDYIGGLTTKTIGSGVNAKKEMIWKIDTSKLQDFLTYSNGSIVKIDQIGFSNNGRFMAVQLNGRGFARVDLQTKELVPFFIASYPNGAGTYMHLSNDGRYITTSRINSSAFYVHDLVDCQNKYSYGNWPASGTLQTTGCQSAQMYSAVQQATPTTEYVYGMRLSPNGSTMTAFVRYRDGSTAKTKRIKLLASSYTSNADGYLAMGDSFSSGEGDGQGGAWYEQGTDEQGDPNTFAGRNLCHLSRRSYPYLMALDVGLLVTNTSSPEENGPFHSVACSGAKIHNIIGIVGEKQDDGSAVDFSVTDNQYRFSSEIDLLMWQPGYGRQLGYVNSRKDNLGTKAQFNPEIITLGIGGNDVGFGDKLVACVLPGTCEFASNPTKRAQVAIEIAHQKKRLEIAYTKIKQEAPDSRIYVHGYPTFVQDAPASCGANVLLNTQEISFISNAVIYYNQVIKAAADAAGVVYVDVEDVLENANLCSGASDETMAFNGATAGNDRSPLAGEFLEHGICLVRHCLGSESFHPNQRGHEKYAHEILRQTFGLTIQNPEPVISAIPIPEEYFGIEASSYISGMNTEISPDHYARFKEMVLRATNYRETELFIDGLQPNSSVTIEIHSTPIQLDTSVVDNNGEVKKTILIPEELESGYHELHVKGRDPFGVPVEYYQSIFLGEEENDYDGDSIEDDVDSCPLFINTHIDIDSDGIDDVCDEEVIAPEPETPPVDEEEIENNEETPETEEETPNEEPEKNSTVAGVSIKKGEQNNETVAGLEPILVDSSNAINQSNQSEENNESSSEQTDEAVEEDKYKSFVDTIKASQRNTQEVLGTADESSETNGSNKWSTYFIPAIVFGIIIASLAIHSIRENKKQN